MKKLIYFAMLTLAFRADKCFAACAPAPFGLVSLWRAEGNAEDIVGGNDGTLENGATFAAGKVGQAFSFNGTSSSDVVIHPRPELKFTTQFSLEAWIKPTDVGNYRQIFSWLAVAPDQSYQLGLAPNGALRMDISGDGIVYNAVISTNGALTANTWAHVAGTFDRGALKLFVNGVQIASATSAITSIFTGTTYNMYIGTTPLGQQRFDGLIDELSAYNRALSASEIQAIYNADNAGKCTVAVFDDSSFVLSDGSTAAGSDNLQASIGALGYTVQSVKDLTAAATNAPTVVIPSLQNGDLASLLTVGEKVSLRDFVTAGGSLIISGSASHPGRAAAVLNSVFGFRVQEVLVADSLSLARSGQSAYRPFAGGPPRLPVNQNTAALINTSLPPLARAGYERNGRSPVVTIPFGRGRVVYLGWDWNDAAPSGTQDGGWTSVLRAALKEKFTLPFVGPVVVWGDPDFINNMPNGLAEIADVAAGFSHAVALKSDGTVVAWPRYASPATNVPPGLSNVVQVSAGAFHSLALKRDGTVVAWGENAMNQTNVPPGLSNVVKIAAGYECSLALRDDGTVVEWGSDGAGIAALPASLTNAVTIAAGWDQGLAVRTDGSLASWGDNSFGSLNIPPGLSNVVDVAGAFFFSAALRSDGTVASWELAPPTETGVRAIEAGDQHALGLTSNGVVFAWGSDYGHGETVTPPTLANAFAISAGQGVSMALATPPACPPDFPDDFRCRALLAGTNIFFTTSNVGATDEQADNEPVHSFNVALSPNKSIWYTWSAPFSGGVTITATSENLPLPVLAVYAGESLASLHVVARNSTLYSVARTRFTASAGQAYQIVLDGSPYGGVGSGEGNFAVSLRLTPPPSNDSFSNALAIPGSFYQTTDSFLGAGREPGEPTHGSRNLPETLWWSWTAPTNAGLPTTHVRLVADSVSLPPDIGVYTGSVVDALAPVPFSTLTNGMTRVAEFTANSGTTYRIALAGQQHDPAGNIAFDGYGTYRFRLFNRSVVMDFPPAGIASYFTNGMNACGAATNGFSATATITNYGSVTTGPLRVRLEALSGISARGATEAAPAVNCDLGTFLVTPSALAAGGNVSVPLAGAVPPNSDPQIDQGSTGTGTGWGVYASLQEQELDGPNWFTLDQTLVLFGDWPTLGEMSPGPGGGVIRLDPGYVGLSAFDPLKDVVAIGPGVVPERAHAQFSGLATYSSGTARPFTNTLWTVTPSNLFSITTNGVFTSANVSSNAPAAISVLFRSGGLPYSAVTNVLVSNIVTSLAGYRVLSNGAFALMLNGAPAQSYALQAATNLPPPTNVWVTLTNVTAGTNGSILFNDVDRTNFPRRFYRAVEL